MTRARLLPVRSSYLRRRRIVCEAVDCAQGAPASVAGGCAVSPDTLRDHSRGTAAFIEKAWRCARGRRLEARPEGYAHGNRGLGSRSNACTRDRNSSRVLGRARRHAVTWLGALLHRLTTLRTRRLVDATALGGRNWTAGRRLQALAIEQDALEVPRAVGMYSSTSSKACGRRAIRGRRGFRGPMMIFSATRDQRHGGRDFLTLGRDHAGAWRSGGNDVVRRDGHSGDAATGRRNRRGGTWAATA